MEVRRWSYAYAEFMIVHPLNVADSYSDLTEFEEIEEVVVLNESGFRALIIRKQQWILRISPTIELLEVVRASGAD